MKYLKNKFKKEIPFITASKTIKYLGIYLIKEVKVFYTENYKTLMIETEEDTSILYSGIRRNNIVKLSILPKAPIDSM